VKQNRRASSEGAQHLTDAVHCTSLPRAGHRYGRANPGEQDASGLEASIHPESKLRWNKNNLKSGNQVSGAPLT